MCSNAGSELGSRRWRRWAPGRGPAGLVLVKEFSLSYHLGIYSKPYGFWITVTYWVFRESDFWVPSAIVRLCAFTAQGPLGGFGLWEVRDPSPSHEPQTFKWVVTKIMVPFWVPNIVPHLLFRVPKKGALILTPTHIRHATTILQMQAWLHDVQRRGHLLQGLPQTQGQNFSP